MQQQKVQLTLTSEEAAILAARGAQLGYSPARYIKFLITREAARTVEESKIPTFKMSKKAEKVALNAREKYKQGKVREVSSFAELGQ